MRARITTSAQRGRAFASGCFSNTYGLGEYLVVYKPGYKRDALDTAKYVMLLASQRAPHNPHLPAMFQLADGSVACARYDKHAEGIPSVQDDDGYPLRVTRASVRVIAEQCRLSKAETDALHVIVDVVSTMPIAKRKQARWDIKWDNVMLSEKTLIWTDPIFFVDEI